MAVTSGYNTSQKYYYWERYDGGNMYMSNGATNYVMNQYDDGNGYGKYWDYLKKKVYYTDSDGKRHWYWQYIYDSDGNHSMVSGAGAKITGGSGKDTVSNEAGKVQISVGAGNDNIWNRGASVKIYGGTGNDTIDNGGAKTAIYGDAGNDSIVNSGANVTVNGGAGNDSIYNYGEAQKSKLLGGEGNDSIENHSASVTVDGGSGDDSIGNYASSVTIDGGAGADYIYNHEYAKNSKLSGGAGNDSIQNGGWYSYGGSNVTMDGGAGDDSIQNYAGNVTIDGGAGADYIYSEGDSVIIRGGDGDDEIESYGEKITINGGTGNDYIKVWKKNVSYDRYGKYNGDVYTGRVFEYAAGDGDDTIEGFTRNDRLSIDLSKAQYSEKIVGEDILVMFGEGTILLKGAAVNLDLTDLTSATFSLSGGSKTADAYTRTKAIKLTGNALDNVIIGGKGADTLNGGAGDDTLTGGKGVDVFVYTGGHDLITDYTTADKISLGSGLTYSNHYVDGKDLILQFGEGNSLTIMNGANKKITTVKGKSSTVNVYTNELKINNDSTAVTLSSSAKDFSASGYTKLVTIDGSQTPSYYISSYYGVKIAGNKLSNKIIGTNGHDILSGGDGNDSIFGGTGNDTLSGGKGNDSLSGGAGDDSLSGGTGNDTLDGGTGYNTLTGGSGNDLFVYNGGSNYITDYAAGDKISIKANFESILTRTELDDSDSVLILGKNEIRLKNTRGKTLNITDSTGRNFSVLVGGLSLTDADKSKVIFTEDIEFANASAREKNIIIKGNSLANSIIGGSGNDILYGGDDYDTLWGGAGNDTLYGGAGDDTFIYKPGEGTDKIMDYSSGDMLKILKSDGKEGGTFTKATFKKNTLTLAISGGGSVIFNGVAAGDNININGTSYTISGKTLK